MVATLWLLSLLSTTLLSTSECVYASPLAKYRLSDTASLGIQNNLPVKRTKHSLSIVNPLDVLRQRLLLEMARRQMRENTKQVEINREILKNIGKRNNYQLEREYPPMQPKSLNRLFGPMVAAERSFFPLEPEFMGKSKDNENRHRFYKPQLTIEHHMDEEDTPLSEHGAIEEAEQQRPQQQQQPDDLTQDDQARIQMDEQTQQEPQDQQQQQKNQQHRQRELYDDESFSQKFNWKNY